MNSPDTDSRYELYELNRLPRSEPLLPEEPNTDTLAAALPFLFKPSRTLALHSGAGGHPLTDPYSRWLIKLDLPTPLKQYTVLAVLNRHGSLSLWRYEGTAEKSGLLPLSLVIESPEDNRDKNSASKHQSIDLIEKNNKKNNRDNFHLMRFNQSHDGEGIVFLQIFTPHAEHLLRLNFLTFLPSVKDYSPENLSISCLRVQSTTSAASETEVLWRQIGGWNGGTGAFFLSAQDKKICRGSINNPQPVAGSGLALVLPTEIPDTVRLWASAEHEGNLALGGNADAVWFKSAEETVFSRFPTLGLIRALEVIPAVISDEIRDEFGLPSSKPEIYPLLILAGCDDYRLYILNKQGHVLQDIFLGGQIDSIVLLNRDKENHAWIDVAIVVRTDGLYCARIFYDQLKWPSSPHSEIHAQLRQQFITHLKKLAVSPNWIQQQLQRKEIQYRLLGLLAVVYSPTSENRKTFEAYKNDLDSNTASWLVNLVYLYWIELQRETDITTLVKQKHCILSLLATINTGQCHARFALRRYADWLQNFPQYLVVPSELVRIHELEHGLVSSDSPKSKHDILADFVELSSLLALTHFRHLLPVAVHSWSWVGSEIAAFKNANRSGLVNRAIMLPSSDKNLATVLVSIRGDKRLRAFHVMPNSGDRRDMPAWTVSLSRTDDTGDSAPRVRDLLCVPGHPSEVLIVTQSGAGWLRIKESKVRWFSEQLPFASLWAAAFSADGRYLALGGEWYSEPHHPSPIYLLERNHTHAQWQPVSSPFYLPKDRLRLRVTALAWAKNNTLWATAGGRGEVLYWEDTWSHAKEGQAHVEAKTAGVTGMSQYALAILEQPDCLAVCGGDDGVLRAFDHEGRLRWLNVLTGSIRGITAHTLSSDQHQYAQLAVLCDAEHLFLFDHKGAQCGILHLPHWTFSSLARTYFAGKTYHILGDLAGKILVVAEMPQNTQPMDMFFSAENQQHLEQYRQRHITQNILQNYCTPRNAQIHPLRAAWAAGELINSHHDFETVIALLEDIKTQFDGTSCTLRAFVFHVLGKAFADIPNELHQRFVSLCKKTRDGALASLLCALSVDVTVYPELRERIVLHARHKAIKGLKPHTTQALLQRFRQFPSDHTYFLSNYTQRIDALCVSLLAHASEFHGMPAFIEGILVILWDTLEIKRQGILAGFSKLPDYYPKLNQLLMDKEPHASLVDSKHHRQLMDSKKKRYLNQFINWIDHVSQSIFSSQETTLWKILKPLFLDLSVERYTVELKQVQQQIAEETRALKKSLPDVLAMNHFMRLLPSAAQTPTEESLPDRWVDYARITVELQQTLTDSASVDIKVTHEKLKYHQHLIKEIQRDTKDSTLLRGFTQVWAALWLDVCERRLHKLSHASVPIQTGTTPVGSVQILSDIFSLMQEKGFNNGYFYRVLEVYAENSQTLFVLKHCPTAGHTAQSPIELTSEEYQRYFGAYIFKQGYPTDLRFTEFDEKNQIKSLWFNQHLKETAHLELPYLQPFQNGCRPMGFWVFDQPDKAPVTYFWQSRFSRSEQDISKELMHQLKSLTRSFWYETQNYDHEFNRLDTLLNKQYKVDEQLITEVQKTIIFTTRTLSTADYAVLWRPGSKYDNSLYVADCSDEIVMPKDRRLLREDESAHISVQCWVNKRTYYQPNWTESEQKKRLLAGEKDPQRRELWGDKIKSLVSFPVFVGDTVLAVLTLYSVQSYHFDVPCVSRLQILLSRCHWFLYTLYLHAERSEERRAWEEAMIHEIRSDLSPLMQRLSQARRMPQRAEKYLCAAQQCADELYDLTDNFMAVTGHGHIDLMATIPKPGTIIQKFLADYAFYIRDKQQVTNFEDSQDDEIWMIALQGKEEVFARVVRNLLHNALKYGGVGADIQIMASTTRFHDEWRWHLSISNPGHMSAEEDRLKFEPRATLTPTAEGHTSGAHVGLASSLSCARAYQAELNLRNDNSSREQRVIADLWWPLATIPLTESKDHDNL